MASTDAARLPPVLKRHGKWFWVGQGLCVLGTPLVCVTAAQLGWRPNFYYALAGAVLGSLATIGLLMYLNSRDILRVRRLRGHVCTMCLYDLSALPASGRCPECGVEYTKADIMSQWRKADSLSKDETLYSLEDGGSGG
ncbi:MAG: hypothetical protein ACFCBV_14385 [Phycisphaerales bacterium]